MDSLEALRARIDDIDERLVDLMNERARVVSQIGELKRSQGTPIYAPHREQAVLRRALDRNQGPLSDRAVEAVFRELMSASFQLERPIRVGYLGPPGSFSHVAAVAHFGSSVDFDDLSEIRTVFTDVKRGRLDYGMVPIENSTVGGVADTLDAFTEPGEISIYAEVLVAIRHHLLVKDPGQSVETIYSRPEIFSQCRGWLSTHFPGVTLVPTPSSSHAVVLAQKEARSAAVASELAGRIHGMEVLFQDIEDNPNNVTRFFVLARERAEPSGDDKTSFMLVTKNQPGALAEALAAFRSADVNLTHIDKRPSGRENWTYTFFLDAEGHRDDSKILLAADRARPAVQSLTILGSYPRATRIL